MRGKGIKRSQKAGLPPGSLVHIGEKKSDKSEITLIDYNERIFSERKIENIEESLDYKDKGTVTWVNIEGIHDVRILEKVGDAFSFHSLIIEDILNTEQYPKVDDLESYMSVIMKIMWYDRKNERIEYEQISIILTNNYVFTFQEGKEGDIFEPIRERIRNNKGRIRKMGTDYLAYALIDAMVDNIFVVLEHIAERLETLEDKLLTEPSPRTLQEIHDLKKQIVYLRKAVWPLREIISRLQKGESALIKKDTLLFLGDVYDHVIQAIDMVETFREMISGILDIYLSSISNKMNEVMKVLTIISTIFIPLTFIAGLYGMNFRYMPELEWHFGYPACLILMLFICVSMILYFRKKDWL